MNEDPVISLQPDKSNRVAEGRLTAKDFAASLFRSWALLNTIILRREATIRKRWIKKTQAKRREILLEAWPNMERQHRPDLVAVFSNPEEIYNKRSACLWPHINLEDLLKPNSLLLLLNSRGRNGPHAFATADMLAMNLGIATGVIDRACVEDHTTVLDGRETAETFEELIARREWSKTLQEVSRGRESAPGDVLLLLEAQERLYRFLVDCCKLLLQEMPLSELKNQDVEVQLEPLWISGNETGFYSLAVVAAEAPYRLPANTDFKRLQFILAAKLSAAEDHLWALREDPGYFSESVVERFEHTLERSTRDPGKTERDDWKTAIETEVTSSVLMVEMWECIKTRMGELSNKHTVHESSVSLTAEVPEDLMRAFLKMACLLTSFLIAKFSSMKQGLFASPPLRPVLQNKFVTTSLSDAYRAKTILGPQGVHLLRMVMAMNDPAKFDLIGPEAIMDELERLIKKESNTKGLFTPWVLNQYSEVAVLYQCLHQIHLFMLWAGGFQNENLENKHEQQERRKIIEQYENTSKMRFEHDLVGLGSPLNGNFAYPVDKRRTRDNVNKMRESEARLDAFWQAVDADMASTGIISPYVAKVLSQRVLQRTTEYQGPPQTKPPNSANDAEELLKPLSELYFERELLSERTTTSVESDERKPKIKTRGTSKRCEEDMTSTRSDVPPQKEDIQRTFTLDKRALKVFKTLFFVANESAQPGEISWSNFLHAMVSTGFSPEKIYGSVWQFTPTQLEVERSIQFHEPHPGGKLRYEVARRYGRRLNRAYGWHGGMFVAK